MIAPHVATLRHRSAILLLVVALHTALLLLASRWRTSLDFRSEESLIFLPLPSHVQAPAETPAVVEPPRKKPAVTRETQLIVVPKELPPAPPAAPQAAIDWDAEAALAAKQQAQAAATSPRALDPHGGG